MTEPTKQGLVVLPATFDVNRFSVERDLRDKKSKGSSSTQTVELFPPAPDDTWNCMEAGEIALIETNKTYAVPDFSDEINDGDEKLDEQPHVTTNMAGKHVSRAIFEMCRKLYGNEEVAKREAGRRDFTAFGVVRSNYDWQLKKIKVAIILAGVVSMTLNYNECSRLGQTLIWDIPSLSTKQYRLNGGKENIDKIRPITVPIEKLHRASVEMTHCVMKKNGIITPSIELAKFSVVMTLPLIVMEQKQVEFKTACKNFCTAVDAVPGSEYMVELGLLKEISNLLKEHVSRTFNQIEVANKRNKGALNAVNPYDLLNIYEDIPGIGLIHCVLGLLLTIVQYAAAKRSLDRSRIERASTTFDNLMFSFVKPLLDANSRRFGRVVRPTGPGGKQHVHVNFL